MTHKASRAAIAFENWREQVRRGGLDLAVLLSVAPGPRYGLEILRSLEVDSDLVVSEGTIYPILARLTRDGLLGAEWVTSGGSHPRKYYRLSDTGRRQLDHMSAHWEEFIQKIARLRDAAEGDLR
jgi:PadR family transcriptional regulator PadR